MMAKSLVVPVEGIEPPLLAERDFESRASTSSATRASARLIYSPGARVYHMDLRMDLPTGLRMGLLPGPGSAHCCGAKELGA